MAKIHHKSHHLVTSDNLLAWLFKDWRSTGQNKRIQPWSGIAQDVVYNTRLKVGFGAVAIHRAMFAGPDVVYSMHFAHYLLQWGPRKLRFSNLQVLLNDSTGDEKRPRIQTHSEYISQPANIVVRGYVVLSVCVLIERVD